MRVLIVDDEPPARERLARLIEEMAGWEIAGTADNGHEALDACVKSSPDVILMDIRMPGMDGVEAARHLSALDEPPPVIFTTAYDQYAIDAFEAQAVGYLLKPIRKEKLERALQHASRLSRPQLTGLAAQRGEASRRAHICARVRGELRLIPADRILYFQADQKYVTVRHMDGEDLIDEPLKELEQEFSPEFVRIHRNALVAVAHLEAVEKDDAGHYRARIRHCADLLSVSRRHAADLKRAIRSA